MNKFTIAYKYNLIMVLTISLVLVSLNFAFQGNKGFNLADEGFLWYGAQRVVAGEVPLRDFMAYDPGRYYWIGALFALTGHTGVMAARVASTILEYCALCVGLFLIVDSVKLRKNDQIPFVIVSAVTMILWMFTLYKIFDICMSIFLIGILSFLIKNPTPKHYLLTGIGVGAVAVFGRNHGLYGALGSMGVMVWLHIHGRATPGIMKGALLWGIGVIIGFSPIIFMAIFVPGFADAFRDSIDFLIKRKSTNLPLPVPWFWTVPLADMKALPAMRAILVGLFFMSVPIFGISLLLSVIWRRIKGLETPPTLVAAAFMSLPYAHYVFSRADMEHLSLGIFPLLIGVMVIAANSTTKVRWLLATPLLLASYGCLYASQPARVCSGKHECVGVQISGSTLWVSADMADNVKMLHQLADQYAPNGRSFVVVPFWPGAYALLGQKSPMWDIYALFPHSEDFEKQEIERIKAAKPGFVLLWNLALDGHDDLKFKNTHPLINRYIMDNFSPVPYMQNPDYQIYKERTSSQ
ncbi:MAG: hypothetical protein ABF636_01765 [Acetobacter sp.]